MKRVFVGLACLAGCVLATACQVIVGIEDRVEAPAVEDAGADGATTSDGGLLDADADGGGCAVDASSCLEPDAAPPAGCPSDCLPPAPEGWIGPIATYDGPSDTKPTDCPAAYPQKDLETHVGLSAPAATCACGAAVVTGRKCSASIVTFTDSACSGLGAKVGVASSDTSCAETSDQRPYYRVDPAALVPGTCTFPAAKTTLPPLTFAKVELACGLAQASACASRPDCVAAPAPPQPFSRLCIRKDGDWPCPAQDYAQRFVSSKTVDDKRACTACTATPTGGACGSSWGNRANTVQCVVFPPPSDKTAGVCYPYSGSAVVDVGAMGPSSATCTPSGGAPTGAATSLDAVTFCCNR